MIDSLSSLFIRPSRHSYSTKDLGPQKIKIKQKYAFRHDFHIQNKYNHKIHLSSFLFQQLKNTSQIIIYLHCNSGSRVQGTLHAKQLLQANLPLLVFDFSGSGISDGQFVTLGLNQAEDLQTVVNYLKQINQNLKIGLWGRSMGAVASIVYLASKPLKSIQVAVYDSPFSNLKQLALDIGNQLTNIPKFMIQGLIKLFNTHLKAKTNLDLMQKLNINNEISKVNIAGLFLGSKIDKLVPFKHIQSLYSRYQGYKQIYYLEEDHHQRRSDQTIDYIIKFLKKHLKDVPKNHKKSIPNLLSGISYKRNKQNRNSFQPIKKLQIITDRKQIKKHKQYFDKAKQVERKKFILITECRPNIEDKNIKYNTQIPKLHRNQTEYLKCKQNLIRTPISLCKKIQQKIPFKDIINNV